ncbi:hypothetical protein D3C87_1390310 [compost metagenome]
MPISLPAIALAESSDVVRSSKSSSMMNISAELGRLAPPLGESPGKATTLWTPGSAMAVSDIRLTTASVRSSDAPVGSWATPTRKYLSCIGRKPAGT